MHYRFPGQIIIPVEIVNLDRCAAADYCYRTLHIHKVLSSRRRVNVEDRKKCEDSLARNINVYTSTK